MAEMDELWHELLDCVAELKDDAKSNRRMSRHVRSLDSTINEIGKALTNMSDKGKKRW